MYRHALTVARMLTLARMLTVTGTLNYVYAYTVFMLMVGLEFRLMHRVYS